MNKKSKIALVTGGSRGLGKSTVLALAKRGVESIFTYKSAKDEADKVVELIKKEGVKSIALKLDTGETSTFEGFAKAVKKALDDLGATHFDYLVNNAGISHHKNLTETTEEELDQLYYVNYKGVFFLTQKLLPVMKDGGSIVNIATGLTRFCVPGSGAYASLKGAIEVYTRYLAKELGPRGIKVNSVAPGTIHTDFSPGIYTPKFEKFISGITALGRVGEPDDIGPMVASLLSDDNHWMTAQRLEVSGGMFL